MTCPALREKTALHRRARACPSPCPGLRSNPPGSLGCGRFPQRWRDRGGQAPALRWRKAALHRRARACPSPCVGLRSNPPWSLGCGRFPQRSRDRGGQAPALRKKRHPLTVGPSFCCQTLHPCSSGSPDPELFVIRRAQTTDGETHRDDGTRGGQAPALRKKTFSFSRRARALGCRTRRRGKKSRPGGLSYRGKRNRYHFDNNDLGNTLS